MIYPHPLLWHRCYLYPCWQHEQVIGLRTEHYILIFYCSGAVGCRHFHFYRERFVFPDPRLFSRCASRCVLCPLPHFAEMSINGVGAYVCGVNLVGIFHRILGGLANINLVSHVGFFKPHVRGLRAVVHQINHGHSFLACLHPELHLIRYPEVLPISY